MPAVLMAELQQVLSYPLTERHVASSFLRQQFTSNYGSGFNGA